MPPQTPLAPSLTPTPRVSVRHYDPTRQRALETLAGVMFAPVPGERIGPAVHDQAAALAWIVRQERAEGSGPR